MVIAVMKYVKDAVHCVLNRCCVTSLEEERPIYLYKNTLPNVAISLKSIPKSPNVPPAHGSSQTVKWKKILLINII